MIGWLRHFADLFPSADFYHNDRDAIESDWRAVGDDMQDAMNTVRSEPDFHSWAIPPLTPDVVRGAYEQAGVEPPWERRRRIKERLLNGTADPGMYPDIAEEIGMMQRPVRAVAREGEEE